MNQILNNIFDDESIEAIKRANSSSSGQRESSKSAENKTMEQHKPSDDFNLIKRQLESKIQEQANRITVLINSQNQMIKEFNELQAIVKTLKAKIAQTTTSAPMQTQTAQHQTTSSEPKKDTVQQNGAGAGLNPEEFSVEKHFYFGK